MPCNSAPAPAEAILPLRPGLVLGLVWSLLLMPAAASAAPVTDDQRQLSSPRPAVVLLHGLARRAGSMQRMADALQEGGFEVCNLGYPSREHSVEVLAANYVLPSIRACFPDPQRPLNFVTHSMGGLLVRQLAATVSNLPIARVVMLSPPNHGSEVVDKLGGLWLFRAINGPAGGQLGTGAQDLPERLGPPAYELGVLTGTRSVNPLLSLLITGANDGKVSVASARLDGMRDFMTLPVSHPFIMRNPQAIAQTLGFLREGRFQRP